MVINLLNIIVLNCGIVPSGIAIGEDIKNNVLPVDHIHNVSQFKRILKKHFLYNYSLKVLLHFPTPR